MGAATVGSAAALATACAPVTAPPAATSVATPVAPTAAPTAVPTPQPTLAPTATTGLATLKIGVLVPYTESSIGVDIGLNQKRAADLYLKQHGGKLGGRAVSLVYSAESIEAPINKVKVQTLLGGEKVGILMGAASTDTAIVMRAAAESAKVVFLATNATGNALTRATPDCAPTCRSPYLFRTSATSWQLSEPLGEWAAKHGAGEFFVSFVDETFGSESADAFVAGLEQNGGKATDRQSFPNGGDWSKAAGAIKHQSTKNVFAAFHTDDGEGFLGEWQRQGLAEAGFKLFAPGFLTEQEVLDVTRSAADGVVTAHFWSSELDNGENKALVDEFPKEYIDSDTGQPVELTGYAVAMWDAMAALDAALKQTGGATTDSNALIAALEGVSVGSPRSSFGFDKASHNPITDILIRQVQPLNGKLVNAVIDRIPRVVDPGT